MQQQPKRPEFKIHREKGPDFIRIHRARGKANGRLRVVSFKDGEWYVSYSPGLDLSYYAKTEKESLKLFFEIALGDYLDKLFRMTDAEVDVELGKYSFKRNRFQRKKFNSNAPFIDKQGILQNFNLPAE